jgi:AcrR family transcriptional regulator
MSKRLNTTLRREQIAEAALDLVAEQGIGALTARNVARAVGVTPPALYRHFPGGKADILLSVIDLLDSVKTEGIRHALEKPGSSMTRLRRCFDLHISVIERYRAMPILALSDSVWVDEPQCRTRLLESHRRHEELLSAIIRAGQEAGEIRRDIDAEQIFVQFLGQFLTIAILYSRRRETLDPKVQAESNWRMFERAVSA